ncbi:MAG: response regulator transcription factor [Mobilitalea sp.]
MIKVMIVDDEPYIRQGLRILINWEQYGFAICGEAANGKEAAELLESMQFDLVITDIKMPIMNGIELIEHTWEHLSKQIRFIILSGFYEFEYAKKAIKYGVVDYVLKPVQKDELIRVMENYKEQFFRQVEDRKRLEFSEKIVFDRCLSHLISGQYDLDNLEYVKKYIADAFNIRYINIEYDLSEEKFSGLSKEDKLKAQNLLYDSLKDYLGEHWYHAYEESNSKEGVYGVGFLYVKKLTEAAGLSEKEYIQKFYEVISSLVSFKIILYIGQKMDNISQISESYKSATIAKTIQLFSKEKDIAYYDELEGRIRTNKYAIDKEMMDELIRAIEENDAEIINRKIASVYGHFKDLATEPDIIKINLDYLLFNLISLAKNLDTEFDQEEVYKMISQGGYEQIAVRGSVKHFREFALEFSNYLSQLRQHSFGGVIKVIEKEITENYMDNLSLKSLSEKYYINSAYLGQMFKKQFGNSFKDYLNNYRIDRAAELLIRSDEKIYLIANSVGFNNTDYFISKFVQIKGITPLQYRKHFINKR